MKNSENDTTSGVCKSATIIPPIRKIETTVGGVRATLLHLVATERETCLTCREHSGVRDVRRCDFGRRLSPSQYKQSFAEVVTALASPARRVAKPCRFSAIQHVSKPTEYIHHLAVLAWIHVTRANLAVPPAGPRDDYTVAVQAMQGIHEARLQGPGDVLPNFEAEHPIGDIRSRAWLEDELIAA